MHENGLCDSDDKPESCQRLATTTTTTDAQPQAPPEAEQEEKEVEGERELERLEEIKALPMSHSPTITKGHSSLV